MIQQAREATATGNVCYLSLVAPKSCYFQTYLSEVCVTLSSKIGMAFLYSNIWYFC